MKKLFTFIAGIAGLAVFLLLTAHFTLRHALNTPKFKAAATGFIERATGRPADYERIGYTLRPFSLVVRNAALKEKDGSRDFAAMKEFSIFVDFRTKEVTALRLDAPAIRIVQYADGSFNFSDLLSAEPTAPGPEAAPTESAPEQSAPTDGPTPPPTTPPAAPAFSIRWVQIDNARFEFVRVAEDGSEEIFELSDLDFQLRDFAPNRPFRMDGSVTIGKTSALQFELSGPAPADYEGKSGDWPLALASRLDIRDFADLKAFLPEGTLPFQSLWMTLNVQGALADKCTVLLNLQTPAATETHPVALEAGLHAEFSLPGPVAQHLLASEPLPADLAFAPPRCTPPPGTVALTENPLTALLLRHVQATAELTFPRIAYGSNRFEQGTATIHLRNGIVTIPSAKLSAYGGTLEAHGNAQLLACPLAYRLDLLKAENLALEQALAANGLGDLAQLSGRLQLEASATGTAIAADGLRALAADAQLRIDDLQSVGTGGSLMDQVWLQLDHPLLLQLVPRLKTKVEQAQQAAATTTTSRYDEATATLSLRNGTATLSGARLAMPGYRLDVSGAILPFDDRLDLAAQLVASPEETARLTGGKDLSAYLPHENGGLRIPLSIRGPLQKPAVLPDLDRLLRNALAGATEGGSDSPLDALSKSDRKNVEKGLKLLENLLQP
ncbi:MAG: hypothetical protein EOM72_03710 [Opitutae bacterium]|nr:hypothetical protein [Opitutae bacterium]